MAAIVSSHTLLFFAYACVYVRVCVCDSFHSSGSSLLLWAATLAAIPTKPKLSLSLCLSPSLTPQSKLSRLSIFPLHPALWLYLSFHFSFISLFFLFTLVRFQSYLKTLLFPPLVQPFLLLYETCLYKVNLPLTKGCPSASLGVLEKCFEKCVERIKVRPGARTSSFYLSLLDSWAPKHRQTDAHRLALPFSVFYLTKLTQWNWRSHTTKLFGVQPTSCFWKVYHVYCMCCVFMNLHIWHC